MKKTLPVLVAGLLVVASAHAEIVRMPGGGYSVTESAQMPKPGQTPEQVLQAFGEPSYRHGPVGTPAISSWEYPGFQVYFEEQLVLHTVIKVAGR